MIRGGIRWSGVSKVSKVRGGGDLGVPWLQGGEVEHGGVPPGEVEVVEVVEVVMEGMELIIL